MASLVAQGDPEKGEAKRLGFGWLRWMRSPRQAGCSLYPRPHYAPTLRTHLLSLAEGALYHGTDRWQSKYLTPQSGHGPGEEGL